MFPHSLIFIILTLSSYRHSGFPKIPVLNSLLVERRMLPRFRFQPGFAAFAEHRRFISQSTKPNGLTHIDETGRPRMVDVSSKTPTKRSATARGRIYIPKVAYDLITSPTNTFSPSHDKSTTTTTLSPLEKAKAKASSKGDVLTVAQLAAIMGCKKTSDLIPLCHPLQLSNISVRLFPEVSSLGTPSTPLSHAGETGGIILESNEGSSSAASDSRFCIVCEATVSCEGKTGVEMEALTAVSVGLLTVWDMLKAVAGKEMVIGDIFVCKKEGGKSGDFVRDHQ